MTEEFRRVAGDAIRFYGELSRRVSSVGVGGIAGLLGLHEKLEQALSEVSLKELQWAIGEIKRVLDEMIEIDSELKRLQSIKISFLSTAGGDEGEGGERAVG